MVAEILHPSLGIMWLEGVTVPQMNTAGVLLAGYHSTLAMPNAFVLPQCLSHESFVLSLVSVVHEFTHFS